MFGSLEESGLIPMDDTLSYDMSFSNPSADSSSSYLNSSETDLRCLYTNLPFEDEADEKPFQNPRLGYSLTDTFFGDQTQVNYNESYEFVLEEIRHVLKSVCDTYSFPLAQTWSLCCQQGRDGCQQQQSADCISVITSASYVYDPDVLPFFEACSELHLVRGKGIAGKALGTNQPCFATDITGFSATEYPLADYAKMFGLGGVVAIRLRSTCVGPADFILEFFLPGNCKKEEEQKQLLSSISCVIQRVPTSLRVLTDDELAEEDSSFSVKETDFSSWISDMMEAQKKDESFVVSMGPHKEEPQEFKVINQSYYHEKALKRIQPDLRPKGRKRSLATRKSVEKKQVKPDKNISLPVLQQYFPGSLKDAAKNIGVCPTTLKKICREHGIMRWPSRKIKKVGHSLKKLQQIIDSVQGAEGTIQIESFYTNFPELNSPISPTPKPTTQKTSSCSSCGSHDSGSNHCCSKDNKSLLQTQNDEHAEYHHSNEGLVPVPKKRSHVLGDGVFRVKVTYGDLKVRLHMSQDWGFGDLQREIMRQFSIDDMNCVALKYLDDDSEWVLLTCDADLEECMDINIESKKCAIKLFLRQSFHLVPGSSFTGNSSSY